MARIPALLQFADVALLLMRVLVGLVFVTSGWSHAKDPVDRGKSIGQSPGFTRFLGLAELAGGAGVTLGILPQLAALGLILIMLGAIQKKVFVWKTGLWGKHGTDGWHYELLFVAMCLVIIDHRRRAVRADSVMLASLTFAFIIGSRSPLPDSSPPRRWWDLGHRIVARLADPRSRRRHARRCATFWTARVWPTHRCGRTTSRTTGTTPISCTTSTSPSRDTVYVPERHCPTGRCIIAAIAHDRRCWPIRRRRPRSAPRRCGS